MAYPAVVRRGTDHEVGRSPRRTRIAGVLGAALLAAGAAGPARAQVVEGRIVTSPAVPVSNGPTVTWTAPFFNPPRCPREDEIRGWISSYFTPGQGAGVAADLSLKILGGGWKLDLTLTGPQGTYERSFLNATCKKVVLEAVYEIAAVIQGGGPVAGSGIPLPELPPASTTTTSTSTTTSTGEAVRRHWGLLQVSGGVSLGIIKTAMAMLRVGIGYRAPRWGVALTNTFLLPRDVLSGAEPAIYVKMWQWAAGVRGCWIPKVGRVEAGLCGTLEAGLVSATRVDGDRAHQVLPWMGISVGPAMSIRLSKRVRINLGLDITGIPLRPQFVYQGRRDVCCDEKFGGRLFGGLEFLLP